MMTKYSPARGKMLQAGAVIDDLPDEVALDLIARGLARRAEAVQADGQPT
jgi:hypothetical protein